MQKQKRAGGGDPSAPTEETAAKEDFELPDAAGMIAALDGGIAQVKAKADEKAKQQKQEQKHAPRKRVNCCGTW